MGKNVEVIVFDEGIGEYKCILLIVSSGVRWQVNIKFPRITKMIYSTYVCVLVHAQPCITK